MKVIKTLLDHGADTNQRVHIYPNHEGQLQTVWCLFLRFSYDNHGTAHPAMLESWYRAFKLLIEHDASPHFKLVLKFEEEDVFPPFHDEDYPRDDPEEANMQVIRGWCPEPVAKVLVTVFPIFKVRSLVQHLVKAHY